MIQDLVKGREYRVIVDLVLVSPVDRGKVSYDVAIVPAQWHRRAELLDHVVRAAERGAGFSILVYATRGDALVEQWFRRRLRFGRRTPEGRFRVQFE